MKRAMSGRGIHYVIVALGLFGFWIILSGKLDATHLIMGGVSSIGVTLLTADLLHSRKSGTDERTWLTMVPWLRIVLYLPWLTWEVIKANIQVLKLVLGPRRWLRPQMLEIDPPLKLEVSRFTLANSITLTPGTVTVDCDDEGVFHVHAIDQVSADGLSSGEMTRRVARTFKEDA